MCISDGVVLTKLVAVHGDANLLPCLGHPV